ncbi:M20 family metallopeptidase [Sedimentibacter saalensis]|uniref:Peptidase M20 domain-containing protein 2 n=1 Tax=Sedimentibacter saalensis TaxID=130788 RepID=A0A562J5G6_9FIRM|nr:M20 family metallopeptidase [Sedimentibacter saalensis]TWH78144.1 amidohydrolase [Sedimentibacter saalensis]
MKEKLFDSINAQKGKLIEIADYIFDNPELSFNEVKASKVLEDYLEEEGFMVERGLGSLNTAFKAVYENGQGGPNIGLLCEYDALPMGHGCGHHMQGPAILGAAVAVKDLCSNKPFKLTVYGTPAEEGGGGKIIMLKEGFIKELDVALMMHGGPLTQVDVKSLAAESIRVIFHGTSSHAALRPEQGRSALDALLLTFQAVEFLREHVSEDTRMHYTVLDAGGAANVVPKTAVGSFSLRSYSSKYLDEVKERFSKIVQGAALMTETTYDLVSEKRLESKVPSYILNDVIMKNAELINAPSIKPAREKTGSTDFGNVTYLLPGAVIRIAFVDESASSHSQEFLNDGKTSRGHDAIISASKILAATVFDLIETENLIDEIKEEFNKTKSLL